MQIIIEGKEAVLKQGSSFDFIAENSLFSGSDSYTLTIPFPLKDCPANIDIFGMINSPEIIPHDIVFDCEIRDKAVSRSGSLTLVEISDIEVKGQFLEGRAVQNFAKDFDDIYINELPLTLGVSYKPSSINPNAAWFPEANKPVAIPWVSADSGITHNFADYDDASGLYKWSKDTKDLTFFPFLVDLTRNLCYLAGYDCDLSDWYSHSWLSRILVCNVLPGSWDIKYYSRALPHWTLAEYFEKLELFLRGQFSIDHQTKKVSFSFNTSILSSVAPVCLENIVDSFSTAVRVNDGCDYLEQKTFVYKDTDHQMSNYYSCPWFIKTLQKSDISEFSDVASLIGYYTNKQYLTSGIVDYAPGTNAYKDPELEKVFYVPSENLHFMLRHIDRIPNAWAGRPKDYYTMQPLNLFGPSDNADDESSSDSKVELEFVPACIDYTDSKHGMCLFQKFSSFSEDFDDESEYRKSKLQHTLEEGEKADIAEYYNMIYVAYYDGAYPQGLLPHPEVFNISLNYSGSSYVGQHLPFNFRLNDPGNPLISPVYKIDNTRKFSFKFISDSIPDPRALFYIHGRRYICEKITATFSEDGMSQLLKGEFWPLLDD